MTPDELAAALFAEHGWLIMAIDTPLEVGQICRALSFNRQFVKTPLRVTGLANKRDLKKQRRLQEALSPSESNLPWHPGPYFYYLEPTD